MLTADHLMARVHHLGGPHACQWNEFRTFGPTKGRFDHHTEPARQQRRGILYATRGQQGFTTAIAEFFQDETGRGVGPVDRRHDDPAISLFRPAQPLTLLDLDSGWVTRAGGNQAITTGLRRRSRQWAQLIYRYHRDKVQGLAYRSAVWGPGQCVALWESSAEALPAHPLASRLLADPMISPAVEASAVDLGTFTTS